MSMLKFWIAFFCYAFGPLYLFNKSSSSTTNLYETDNSNVGAQSESGPALAVHGDGNSIELVDAGAISGSIGLARDAIAGNADVTRFAIETQSDLQQDYASRLGNVVESYGSNVTSLANRAQDNTLTLASRYGSDITAVANRAQDNTLALAGRFADLSSSARSDTLSLADSFGSSISSLADRFGSNLSTVVNTGEQGLQALALRNTASESDKIAGVTKYALAGVALLAVAAIFFARKRG